MSSGEEDDYSSSGAVTVAVGVMSGLMNLKISAYQMIYPWMSSVR